MTRCPKIAQRFNAGFLLGEARESLQGRQDCGGSLAVLSSLTGLPACHHTIFPALKRWAIFRSIIATQRDNLRLVS
jgi:hypothetical protein